MSTIDSESSSLSIHEGQTGTDQESTSVARRAKKRRRLDRRRKSKAHRRRGEEHTATPPAQIAKAWTKEAVKKREQRKERKIAQLQHEQTDLLAQLFATHERESDLQEQLHEAQANAADALARWVETERRLKEALAKLLESEEAAVSMLERIDELEEKEKEKAHKEKRTPQTRLPNGQYAPAFERAIAEAVTKGMPTSRTPELLQIILSMAWQRPVSAKEVPSATHVAKLKLTAGTLAAAVALDAVRSDPRGAGGPGQTLSIDQTTKRGQSQSTINITTTHGDTYLLGVQPTFDKSTKAQYAANSAVRQRAVQAGNAVLGPAKGTQTQTESMLEDVVAVNADEGPTEKAIIRELQAEKNAQSMDMGATEQEVKEDTDMKLFDPKCPKHIASQFTIKSAKALTKTGVPKEKMAYNVLRDAQKVFCERSIYGLQCGDKVNTVSEIMGREKNEMKKVKRPNKSRKHLQARSMQELRSAFDLLEEMKFVLPKGKRHTGDTQAVAAAPG